MTTFTRELLVFVHLLGVIAWFGGMFFAYFCLRPAAAETLDPSQRLPLWAAVFQRFLRYTVAAVFAILVSGLAMLIETGIHTAPTGWLVMAALGLVMTLVFGYVYLVRYPRLSAHCLASAWPAAAIALNDMRRLVALNLVLAVCTVAAAVFAAS